MLEKQKKLMDDQFYRMEALLLDNCRQTIRTIAAGDDNRNIYTFNLFNDIESFHFSIALNRVQDYPYFETGLFSERYNPTIYRFRDVIPPSQEYNELAFAISAFEFKLFNILEGNRVPRIQKKSDQYKKTKKLKKWLQKRFLETGVNVIKELKEDFSALNRSEDFVAFAICQGIDRKKQISLARKSVVKRKFDRVFPEIDEEKKPSSQLKSLYPADRVEAAFAYLTGDSTPSQVEHDGGYSDIFSAVRDLADLRPVCDERLGEEFDKLYTLCRQGYLTRITGNFDIVLWLTRIIALNPLFSNVLARKLAENIQNIDQIFRDNREGTSTVAKLMAESLELIYTERPTPRAIQSILSLFYEKQLTSRFSDDPLKKIGKEYLGLTHLELESHGQITFPKDLGKFSSLRSLQIRGCPLETVGPEIANLQRLESLVIQKTAVSELPMDFYKLENLNGLTLSSNQIIYLDDEIGQMQGLKSLSINKNPLRSLPAGICQLTKLHTLHAQDNDLKTLPNGFGGLIYLQRIDLSHNRLTELPESMGLLTNAREIFLNDNELTCLPDSFKYLTRGTYLYLSGNRFSESERSWMKRELGHLNICLDPKGDSK